MFTFLLEALVFCWIGGLMIVFVRKSPRELSTMLFWIMVIGTLAHVAHAGTYYRLFNIPEAGWRHLFLVDASMWAGWIVGRMFK